MERLWRTVKYEEIYLHSYQNVKEAYNGLKSYFHFYNTIRLHSSLKYMTPYEIYFKEQNKIQNKIQSEDKIKEQVNNLIHLK